MAARSKEPNKGLANVSYTERKSAAGITNFAQKLGIGEVDYAGEIGMGNVCNHALASLKKRGVPVPKALRVDAEHFDETPDDLAEYVPGSGDEPGVILLNPKHDAWKDGGKLLAAAGKNKTFSTGDPHHPIMHDMGELACHQSIGGDAFFPGSSKYQHAEARFEKLRAHVREKVSTRAAVNHTEFVAEVFAALMLGREDFKQDKKVMSAYTLFGGAKIREHER